MKGIPRYPLNQRLRSTATFRAAPPDGSPAGTLGAITDPGTVEWAIVLPDGTETRHTFGGDPDIEKVDVGIYRIDFTLTVPGDHFYAWFGTGAVETTYERHIFGVRQMVAV